MKEIKTPDALWEIICKYLYENPSGILVIDGCCASGKTTLAEKIAETFNADIIHMDDFFLQQKQRTPQRLQEVGGNFDYERFSTEILPHLRQSYDFNYIPYDCHTKTLRSPIPIRSQHPIIIEGVYALHPRLSYPEHLSVCLQVEDTLQKKRLKQRSPQLLERFLHEWIPKENAYFQIFHIFEKADITFFYKEEEHHAKEDIQ